MTTDRKGLAIILHSGSYDRLYHGLSLALAASALGREVRLFFSYWALGCMKKNEPSLFNLDREAQAHQEIIDKNIKAGHMRKLGELFTQAKELGVKFYACTQSMGLLNISRDELVNEIDKSMGITTFLAEVSGDQLLFI